MDLLPAAATALWLGILTSLSPCPMATNVAAISWVGRRLGSPRQVLLGGLLYTLGRALAYTALGAVLVLGLLEAPVLSQALQAWLNRLLGPLLVVIGMFLLELVSLPVSGGGFAEGLRERLGRQGLPGALGLGVLFALSFCPISAALFFGSLVPLAVAGGSALLLPSVYGLGTGLPVVVLALLIALGARSLGTAFDRLSAFEKWARRATGAVFVVVGIYLALVYVFKVLS